MFASAGGAWLAVGLLVASGLVVDAERRPLGGTTAAGASESIVDEAGASGLESSNGAAATLAAASFSDVPESSAFSDDVEWLSQKAITQGCAADRFCPDAPVTRGQMAALLVRSLDLSEGSGVSFEDVPVGSTFAEDVARLASAGITQGCAADRFCPDAPVTRGQMAAFLRRSLEPMACEDGTAEAIPRHGITWSFDDVYPCGRYANGDYWVVGPVTITDIDPPSATSGGRTINGSMVNPSPRDGGRLGYGQMSDIGYDEEKNAAAGVASGDPLVLATDSSLVSTISVKENDGRPGIDTAAVLTVVAEAPVSGSFRPPYSGDDKRSRFAEEQLRYDLLPKLEPVSGTPRVASVAQRFERVWLDHRPGWSGRSIHPRTSMPDYGRDLASRLGEGSLMLMLDFSGDEKRDLLVSYVQIGIDLYGIVEDGGEENWVPNGGHAQGRKWPILFAGLMLDDAEMSGIGSRDDVFFGEDAQTFYVTQADVDRGNGYTSSDVGLAEWGIRHATDPSRDDASWGAPYRECCTANSWGGHVLSARIMDAKAAWSHDPLFDYTDRYVDRQPSGDYSRFVDRPFTENMWEAYRSQY